MPASTMDKQIDREQCRTIREKRRTCLPVEYLADRFGVSNKTVYYHATGRCRHDPDAEPFTERHFPDLAEVLSILRSADDPVLTTREVMDRLTHDYADSNTVKRRLDELVERGYAQCKRVNKAYVWWYDAGPGRLPKELQP